MRVWGRRRWRPLAQNLARSLRERMRVLWISHLTAKRAFSRAEIVLSIFAHGAEGYTES
jgi:hypothetical protein